MENYRMLIMILNWNDASIIKYIIYKYNFVNLMRHLGFTINFSETGSDRSKYSNNRMSVE